MSQKTRVLKMLEDAGDEGVTGAELYGAYMPRFSARILELRDAGHEIRSVSEGGNRFRYTLISKASRAGGHGVSSVDAREPGEGAGVSSPGTDRLFDVPAGHQRVGHYDDEDAA